MDYRYLLVERHGPVALVTLNRPEKLNALSHDLMREIERLTVEFREDIHTRVVIFTGAGRHFTAGRDLTDPRPAPVDLDNILRQQREYDIGPRMIRCLYEMRQITIAAINGAALGGGACIVSALDFRIGAEDCTVGYPEAGLAIPMTWASLPLCIHLIGPARAKRMLILARREKAATLLDWGFLDEVVSRDRLMQRAMEMAAEYAAIPPIAAQMIKRSVNVNVSALDQAIMHADGDQLILAHTTEDFREAVTAFFEKRTGNFKGK